MHPDTLFLTIDQALNAICLDFRGYGPQPMLFCEILRMLFGDRITFQRESQKEGLWIAEGRHRMRWREGADLVEFMCRILHEADLDADRLATLCGLVFQTPCRMQHHPETGLPGIRVQTGMENFKCRQCGRCCSRLNYHDGMTADDVARLKEQGRADILEWVGVTRSADGRTAYRIWVIPGTNRYASPCPFLKQGPTNDSRLCSIHEVKPVICRQYPVSRKHARMTGCPGFDSTG